MCTCVCSWRFEGGHRGGAQILAREAVISRHTSHKNLGEERGAAVALEVALLRETVRDGAVVLESVADGGVLRDGEGRATPGDSFRLLFRPNQACCVHVFNVSLKSDVAIVRSTSPAIDSIRLHGTKSLFTEPVMSVRFSASSQRLSCSTIFPYQYES